MMLRLAADYDSSPTEPKSGGERTLRLRRGNCGLFSRFKVLQL
jgi:hypothetical protein